MLTKNLLNVESPRKHEGAAPDLVAPRYFAEFADGLRMTTRHAAGHAEWQAARAAALMDLHRRRGMVGALPSPRPPRRIPIRRVTSAAVAA